MLIYISFIYPAPHFGTKSGISAKVTASKLMNAHFFKPLLNVQAGSECAAPPSQLRHSELRPEFSGRRLRYLRTLGAELPTSPVAHNPST